MSVEGVKRIRGREYVTAKVFAERMNTTPMTISRYLKAGSIERSPLVKGRIAYFDWEEQRDRFLAARDKAKHITKREARPIPRETYMGLRVVEPGEPEVRDPDVKVPDVEDVLSGRSPLDSIRTAIDPDKEQDCWVTDIKTGERVFSWEVCERKYRAIILSMKARVQAGELLEKSEIAPALSAFGTVLSSELNTSKFKMHPLIVAWAERLGAKVTPEDEIFLNEGIIDPEYTRMVDDLRAEIERESRAFSGDGPKGEADGELDS